MPLPLHRSNQTRARRTHYAVLDLLDALVRKSLLVADRSADRIHRRTPNTAPAASSRCRRFRLTGQVAEEVDRISSADPHLLRFLAGRTSSEQ
jgi:hypothetical protein